MLIRRFMVHISSILLHWCRRGVTIVAHDPSLGGHLGENKTYHKVLAHFYWPKMK